MRKKYRGTISIPAIMESIRVAEEYIGSADKEKQKIGQSMKSLFEKILIRRQDELREAIEKSAKLKQGKLWRKKETKNN